MNENYSAYPSIGIKDNKSKPAQFSLRKLRFAVSPPGQQSGRKRTCNDGDDSEEEQTQASIASVKEQLKHEEDDVTALAIKAVCDFFVLDRLAWQTQHYRKVICRLHTIKDFNNTNTIRSEIYSSLHYWAKWHAETYTKDLVLDSDQACENFLDSFALALANWYTRAVQLQVYFSDYQDPSHRYRCSITETAKEAIDAHFVRDPILWNAVNTAVDRLARWDRPIQKQTLDRIVLLEHVYSNNVRTSPVITGVADPFVVNQPIKSFDLASAPFSPVIHVLQTGIDYSLPQILIPPASNNLEDWAARAKYLIDRVGSVSRYLISGVGRANNPYKRPTISPELHLLQACIEDTLPLFLPQLAAHSLGLLPEVPYITKLLQLVPASTHTHRLLLDHLYKVMYSVTLQITSDEIRLPFNEKLTALDAARDRLKLFSTPESQSLVTEKLKNAMENAVKENASSILIQLRSAVRKGEHLELINVLRTLEFRFGPNDDVDDDDLHSRALAESIAVDLLPSTLAGFSVDPKSELDTMAVVANDFMSRAVAFTWMPLIMATEALKNSDKKLTLMHYVAWLSHEDPLLTTSAPALVPASLKEDPELRNVKWHPSWSVVKATIGGSNFDCSFVQFELIERLLNSTTPLSETALIGEPKEASLARRAALIDLVHNSKGFVRYSAEENLYAIDTSVLPQGSLAVARFPHDDESDDDK